MKRINLCILGTIAAVMFAACGGGGGGGGIGWITPAAETTTPVADAGSDQNVATGSLVTLDGTGSSDADGDALTYSWSFTSKPTGSTATLSNVTTVNPTFTADLDGSYVLRLVVNDGTANSAADTVTITAATANSAPVADAGPDQNVATGSLVTLDGTGSSDADGDALTYSWSFTFRPKGSAAALSASKIVNPTFKADKAGSYVLRLIVNDGTVNSVTDTVTVTAITVEPDVLIPAGCFFMGDAYGAAYEEGDPDEVPQHYVCISEFYMDVHEVTNFEYKQCVNLGGCTAPMSSSSYSRTSYYGNTTYDNFPVVHVTWSQATAYCQWAFKRLPTEAEWEYAARGGLSEKRFPWGDGITDTDANYVNSGDAWDNDTSPIQTYAANGYGLYDVAGNVWEWVNDWYNSTYYSGSPRDDPQGPAGGYYRVLRGGSFADVQFFLRVANRVYDNPTDNFYNAGFRCVRD